ncbi:MAG: transposase [Candidatus Aenigmarchaeota archaeon]|nr:transposase [Candidatus Aenigmarchaeota archaeon]
MQTTPTTCNDLELKIKKAFSELKPEESTIAALLSKVELYSLEKLLLTKYKTWVGDRRLRYDPFTIIKSILYKELKDIKSFGSLISHLKRRPEEAKLLGYKDGTLPCQQSFSVMVNERIDDEIESIIDFMAKRIREIAKEEGKLLDIDFAEDKNLGKKCEKTIKRHVDKEGTKVIRLLREEIFPTLALPLNCKARYCKDNLLDLLAYVAYNNTFANQGYQLMRDEKEFKDNVPHARTMLGYLAKLESEEIKEMFMAAFERIYKIAKARGLLSGPVDLAIDYHDWLYYGDKTDKMVVGGEYKLGTCKRFRFVTIKIAEKYGDFTLLALPVGVFTNEREAVKTLIEYAKNKVDARYFYVDRGFYSAKFISLFDEMGIKYLMPGVKTKRVLRIMKRSSPPAVVEMKLRSNDDKYLARTKLVVKRDHEGKDVAFITNLPTLMLYTANLFRLYGKRWNIETGYRVKKHEFRPNTTSKNHKIRCFYFMFSTLLYNLWVITNAMLSQYLFGEQVEYRLITAKMFMKKFYEAFINYSP